MSCQICHGRGLKIVQNGLKGEWVPCDCQLSTVDSRTNQPEGIMYQDEVDREVRVLADKVVDFLENAEDYSMIAYEALLDIIAEANRLGALSPRTLVAKKIRAITGGNCGKAS
jgi:hypothetical protein